MKEEEEDLQINYQKNKSTLEQLNNQKKKLQEDLDKILKEQQRSIEELIEVNVKVQQHKEK